MNIIFNKTAIPIPNRSSSPPKEPEPVFRELYNATFMFNDIKWSLFFETGMDICMDRFLFDFVRCSVSEAEARSRKREFLFDHAKED
jgi:hypothetical protein